MRDFLLSRSDLSFLNLLLLFSEHRNFESMIANQVLLGRKTIVSKVKKLQNEKYKKTYKLK